VGELLRQTSSSELAEWRAFAQLEPFGAERGDWQAAQVAQVVANANRDSKKQKQPYTAEDFLLAWEEPEATPRRQTMEEQLRTVEMLNAAFGGRDLRKVE
jgi:hypothetical protein